MTDKERYIYNYLNSKSSILSFYVPRMLETKVSKAEYYNYVERILSLIMEIKQILKTMQISNVPINSFFNQLMLLKSCGISEVQRFLDDYNYQRTIDATYASVLRNISLNHPIEGQERLCVEFLISNDMIEDKTLIFEYYLRNILLKEVQISYETFELLVAQYAKLRMKDFVEDPKCIVVGESELQGKESYTFKDTIYLCREDIQLLYYSGIFKVIKNMLHELGHIKQYKEIMLEQDSSAYAMKQIKEEILSAYCPGYYDNNYEKISYEVEAELFGITELLKLFERFGISFKNGKNPYLHTVVKLVDGVNDSRRTVDGYEDTVEELFDFVIVHHPELLTIYPQLTKEYEISFGDLVVRKDEFTRKD